MTAAVEELTRPAKTEEGDDDDLAHVFRREDAVRGYVEGIPIRALCGKVLVPSRDPQDLPVCGECARRRQGINSRGLN